MEELLYRGQGGEIGNALPLVDLADGALQQFVIVDAVTVIFERRTVAAVLDEGNHIIGRLVAIGLRFHAQFGISVGHLCLPNRMESHG